MPSAQKTTHGLVSSFGGALRTVASPRAARGAARRVLAALVAGRRTSMVGRDKERTTRQMQIWSSDDGGGHLYCPVADPPYSGFSRLGVRHSPEPWPGSTVSATDVEGRCHKPWLSRVSHPSDWIIVKNTRKDIFATRDDALRQRLSSSMFWNAWCSCS